jgi:hypothetical protein
MKIRFLSLLPALCLLAFAASSASAQEFPFTLDIHDTSGVTGPNDYKDFKIDITNSTGSDQTLHVERLSNNINTQNGWMSTICTEEMCYSPTDNAVRPMTLAPKQKTFIKLSITGGTTPNESGTVILSFSSGPFTPAVQQQFSLMVATSSVASEIRPAVRISPVPNPASSSTLLPAKLTSTNDLSVRIYDPLGRMAADLSASAQLRDGGVQISVDGLSEGTYFYQLDADGYRGTGTLVVSR